MGAPLSAFRFQTLLPGKSTGNAGLDWMLHVISFYTHPESMNILVKRTDMRIDEIVFDSTEFQFTGSEKYLRNLQFSTPDDIFTKKEIRKFKKESKKLNLNNQGDAACFYLKKVLQ